MLSLTKLLDKRIDLQMFFKNYDDENKLMQDFKMSRGFIHYVDF